MKKIMMNIARTLFFGAGFFLIFTVNAHAYIDPSATTYIVQAVAAAVISIGACFTIFRHKISAFFNKGKDAERREIHMKDENQETENKED